MLTNTQKKQLRKIANQEIETKYQIGKNGINKTTIDLLDKALIAHELIIVDVLKTVEEEIGDIAHKLVNSLYGEVVQLIGRTIILYRKNRKKEIIKLKK